MNRLVAALLGALALVATGLAVAAGGNISAALPAAFVAVVAAALLLVGVAARTRWPSGASPTTSPADPASVRSSLAAGALGREALVGLLDRLERSEKNPNRPNTPREELDRLRSLSPERFRSYLENRLESLERET